MNTLRARFRNRHNEQGDVVQTVLMIPITMIIFFAMINLSSYFNVRAEVENAARNGARLVALYGGNSTAAIKNNTGQSVSDTVLQYIAPAGVCKLSYCSEMPQVSCEPSVVSIAGTPVSCSVRYHYSPIAPIFSSSLRGLNGDFGPMTVTSTSISETGVNGG